MKIAHRLKTLQPYFRAVAEGRKTFEIRTNDRPFAVGDVLQLEEVDHETRRATGQLLLRRVSYLRVLKGLAPTVVVGSNLDLTPDLVLPTHGGELAILGLSSIPEDDVAEVR